MFGLPLKLITPCDITPSLTEWLDRATPQSHLHDASLRTLKNHRSLLHPVPNPPSSAYLSSLKQYHRDLQTLLNLKFPITDGELRSLTLKYSGSYNHEETQEGSNLLFESCQVAYQIGATLSQLAVSQDRTSESGLKIACHQYQLASGVFSHLQTILATLPSPHLTSDLSPSPLNLNMNLMLSQAQTTVYEKAKLNGIKPTIMAKIATSVGGFYATALEHLKAVKGVNADWKVQIQYHMFMFKAAAEYWDSKGHLLLATEKGSGYGREIARLQTCLNFIEQALILTKGCTTIGTEGLIDLKNTATERLEEAKSDNDKIYLEPVPKPAELPQIKRADLVKPLPLTEDMTRGEDLFRGMLSVEGRRGKERFEKAIEEAVKNATALVSTTSNGARASLKRVGLPESLQAYKSEGLPEEVWSKIHEAQVQQPRVALNGLKTDIDSKAQSCSQLIMDSLTVINEASRIDDVFARSNPQYEPINSDHKRTVQHYKNLMDNAQKSDKVLEGNLGNAATRAALGMLDRSREMIEADMPKKESQEAFDTAPLENEFMNLTRLMTIRDAALAKFMGDVESVDLENSFSGAADVDKKVNEMLASFDQVQIDIADNCGRQEELLSRVFGLNEKFSAAVGSKSSQREEYLVRVTSSYQTFNSLKSQLTEGLNFYQSLHPRLIESKREADDYLVTVRMRHQEFVENKERRERTRSQEESDAELARRLAQEVGIDDRVADRERKQREEQDAAYAASLVAMEQEELERENGEQEQQQQQQQQQTPNEEQKEDASTLSSWSSWLTGSKPADTTPKKGGTGLSQPLTQNEYPAAAAPTYQSSSGGNGDAPPVPPPSFESATQHFRTERTSSYEPPTMGGGGAILPPPGPPPPSFESVQRQSGSSGPIDENKVTRIAEMGFQKEDIRKALRDHNGDEEAALNQLLSG
ncbi:hypothetical protein TrST_g13278 [Triparma strigata]|uniref:Uncharacterized protein n=1 Tax=Triparma strigata TaxID=1606541 RepID=A0A9W7AQC9_9STRA|nr:hypothetical protein TrST_g13278 [Triparma strigata]